jgi:hypothetical protein
MSQTIRAVFGAIAVSLTCGAVQFASGRDLTGVIQNFPLQNSSQNSSIAPEASINRGAKADRLARVAGSPARTQTISLRLEGLSATSIVLRIPAAAEEARNSLRAPPVTKPADRRQTVACEPVVSVLTEIAKQLEPGRCVT